MIELEDDGALRIVHVVEDDAALLIERTGGENAGNVGAHEPEPMPPTARCRRIEAHAADVGQRKLQVTAERPELIDALEVEMNPVAVDRDIHHGSGDEISFRPALARATSAAVSASRRHSP